MSLHGSGGGWVAHLKENYPKTVQINFLKSKIGPEVNSVARRTRFSLKYCSYVASYHSQNLHLGVLELIFEEFWSHVEGSAH